MSRTLPTTRNLPPQLKAVGQYLNQNVSSTDLTQDDLQWLQNGLLKVDVFFKTLNEEVIKETSKFTASSSLGAHV